jgi:hypothetical protein
MLGDGRALIPRVTMNDELRGSKSLLARAADKVCSPKLDDIGVASIRTSTERVIEHRRTVAESMQEIEVCCFMCGDRRCASGERVEPDAGAD